MRRAGGVTPTCRAAALEPAFFAGTTQPWLCSGDSGWAVRDRVPPIERLATPNNVHAPLTISSAAPVSPLPASSNRNDLLALTCAGSGALKARSGATLAPASLARAKLR